MTRSHTFSRAFDDVITSSFDWLTGLSKSFVIVRMITVVLAFLHSIKKTSLCEVPFDLKVVLFVTENVQETT